MSQVVGGRSVLGSQKVPSWAAKRFCGRFTKVPPRFSPRNGQQPQGSQECSNGHTSSPRRKQRQSTQAHKHVPTEGTQARQGASSGKAPRLTRVFQQAHKLAKGQTAAASTAKHQGSQACSNCGHTSSPRRKQRQSTQAHKGVPTGTQARQGASSGSGHTSSPRRKQRQSTQAHKSVPTGTQARQGACSGKHPGSQCPNGHTSLPGRMQRQCTKAHKSVPTGTQACQGACSGKAPRLTRVFQRAHKLAKAQAAAKHQGSQECSNGHTSSPRRKQRQSTQAHNVPTEGTQARFFFFFPR